MLSVKYICTTIVYMRRTPFFLLRVRFRGSCSWPDDACGLTSGLASRFSPRAAGPPLDQPRTKRFFRTGLCLLFSISTTLSSCAADKKAATKSNIRAAVQRALMDQPRCLPLSFPAFTLQRTSPESLNAQLHALVSAGLVQAPYPVRVAGDRKSSAAWASPGLEYDLTPLGQKYRRPVTVALSEPQTSLCYAQPEVTMVKSFTEPASFLGQIVTSVTYEYRLVDFAPWALQPGIIQAFHLEHDLQLRTHPETGNTALALTMRAGGQPTRIRTIGEMTGTSRATFPKAKENDEQKAKAAFVGEAQAAPEAGRNNAK